MIPHPVLSIWQEAGRLLLRVWCLLMLMVLMVRWVTISLGSMLPETHAWLMAQMEPYAHVQDIEITWRGIYPTLVLHHVVLHPKAEDPWRIQSQKVALLIKPMDSLINQSMRFHAIDLKGVEVTLDRSAMSMQQVASEHPWAFVPVERVYWEQARVCALDEASAAPTCLTEMKGQWFQERHGVMQAELQGLWDKTPVQASMQGQGNQKHQIFVRATGLPVAQLAAWVGPGTAAEQHEGRLDVQGWWQRHHDQHEQHLHWQAHEPDHLGWFGQSLPAWSSGTISRTLGVEEHAPERLHVRVVQEGAEDAQAWCHSDGRIRHCQAESWSLPGVVNVVLPWWHDQGSVGAWCDSDQAGWLEQARWHMPEDQTSMWQYDVEATFRDLAWFDPKTVGLSGLSGHLHMNEQSGHLELNQPEVASLASAAHEERLEQASVAAHWERDVVGWRVNAHAQINSAALHDVRAQGIWHSSPEHSQPQIMFWGQAQHVDTQAALDLIPLQGIPALEAWLHRALNQGSFKQAKWVVRNHHSTTPQLRVSSMIKDHSIRFDPTWPALQVREGLITATQDRIDVVTQKASFGETLPASAAVIIHDYLQGAAYLEAQGWVQGGVGAAAYLLDRPQYALQSLGSSLKTWHVDGNMDVHVHVALPLGQPEAAVRYDGQVQLTEGVVQQPESWALPLALAHMKGNVFFDHEGVRSTELVGMFDGNPIHLWVDSNFTDTQHPLRFKAITDWSAQRVQERFPAAVGLEGVLPLHVSWSVPLASETLQVAFEAQSTLQGLGLNWPEPVGKTAQQPRDLSLQGWFEDDELHWKGHYGDALQFQHKLRYADTTWHLLGSEFVLGEGVLRDDIARAWLVHGQLGTTDAHEWRAWWAKHEASFALAPGALPWYIDLKATEPRWGVWALGPTRVRYNNQQRNQQAVWVFDGEGAQGTLHWPDRPNDAVTLNLKHLKGHFTEELLAEELPVVQGQEEGSNPQRKEEALMVARTTQWIEYVQNHAGRHNAWTHPMSVHIDRLDWARKHVEGLKIQILPHPLGWKLAHAVLEEGDVSGQLQGFLGFYQEGDPVFLEGALEVGNVGDWISHWGGQSSVRDASGHFQFGVSWFGGVAPHWDTLSGYCQMHLNKGRILGVEPGLGRVLGLLSLSNIRRRLSFDFRDITKKGFAFDEVKGKLEFDKGWVRSKKLSLKGPIANLSFVGSAELMDPKRVDAELLLSPQVSGTLPLAAAIASGNPAVGAAVWLFNRALGKEAHDMIQYRYAVGGSWEAPTLHELEIKRRPKAHTSTPSNNP